MDANGKKIVEIVVVILALTITWFRPHATSPTKIADPELHPGLAFDRAAAAVEVAKVIGRSPDCSRMNLQAILAIVDAAAASEIDPKIPAAVVSIESGCNPLAISNRGAIGLMQVVPKVWASKFDFSKPENNLFNPLSNLDVGTTILAGLVKQYGTEEGIKRYQGLGEHCATCDGTYTARVLKLLGDVKKDEKR